MFENSWELKRLAEFLALCPNGSTARLECPKLIRLDVRSAWLRIPPSDSRVSKPKYVERRILNLFDEKGLFAKSLAAVRAGSEKWSFSPRL
jgi:hypothetical protein